MSNYILSCSSTADLTKEQFEVRNIPVICYRYLLDGEERQDDFWRSLSAHDFYHALRNGSDTATAQVNIAEYLSFFRTLLESGKDVIHICFSSGLSGSFSSAENAARIAREQFPTQKLFVIDSLCASSGYGLFMEELADRRDEGFTIEQLAQWAEKNRLNVQHWFFSSDLSCYLKGGRISKASAVFGGMFHICPLLTMDAQGKLRLYSKPRGKNRAQRECAARMSELCDGGSAYSGRCFISHSDCAEDAQILMELLEQEFPALKGKIECFDIGTTIGSHSGPDTVALFFLGRGRE